MSRAVLSHDWYPEALPGNVVIGERSWLYSSYAFLHYRSRRPYGVRIGRDSGIYNGTFFDLGPHGELIIGDFCSIVGAIIATNGRVEIGNYALIAHSVVIADSFAMAPPDAGNAGQTRRGVTIGQNAWVGSGAILLGGAQIGEGAIVGAASVVDFEVPAYAVVAGNPARIIGSSPPRR